MRAIARHVTRILLILLVFILVGPPVGLVLYIALISLLRLHNASYALPIGIAILSLGPAAIFVVYMLGAPPALAAAISHLATLNRTVAVRTIATVIVGAAVSAALPGLLTDGLLGPAGPLTIWYAIAGGGAAVVCTALAELANSRRPRQS